MAHIYHLIHRHNLHSHLYTYTYTYTYRHVRVYFSKCRVINDGVLADSIIDLLKWIQKKRRLQWQAISNPSYPIPAANSLQTGPG